MGRFKESEIINFLDMYKRHECLWNCNHRHYREKSERSAAYMRIKEVMNLSNVLEVKQKIKSLRDTYASERAKMRKSMLTARHPSEVYRTKLRWFHLADSFLNNSEGNVRVDSSMTSEIDSSAFVRPIGSVQETAEYASSPGHTQPILRLGPIRVRRNHHTTDSLRQQQRRADLPIERDLHYEKDEFYHFGMNVAMQLKSLPLVRALDLQSKFQQMLCETRIACEQSRYENSYGNERCETTSASLEDENPLSPQEIDEIVKEEPSIDEITLYQ